MRSLKNKERLFSRANVHILCIAVLILFAALLLVFNNVNSNQAVSAMMAQVYFDGEYRIGDGEWQKIAEGEHISSTKGDVTLRGNFHMLTPDGEYVGIYRGEIPIAFYTNHINLSILETGSDPFVIDMENPWYGDSACGVGWTGYVLTSESTENVEILIHNPHSFGNENAIDEMLTGIALWSGIDFEKDSLNIGATERNIGLLFIIISLMLLGIAVFSALIHVRNTKIIWVIGIVSLFAGIYFAYSAKGVSFWSESVVSNTTILGISMMLYSFFFAVLTVCLFASTRFVGKITVTLLGAVNATCFIAPTLTDVLFYDTWVWWIVAQLVTNTILAVCLIKEFLESKTHLKWLYVGALLPMIAFALDVIGTWSGAWQGGTISQYVFSALFVAAMIMVLKLVPHNINAAAKAKELEMERIVLNAELAQTRISTMMSQIRPHFIYNTLGSIEQLCDIDPKKAGELVHDFAKYLRGNFRELDNPKPIPMSQEMAHVRHYVSIENVRFPDMTVSFDMKAEDFTIPALTIQPIVENAIKHGLMKLQKGGSIQVTSYETETDYCVSVADDGVGFDTKTLIDAREHVGLRNIRERLKAMVNGTLEIESTIGVGTKVLIKIPKEGKK